MSWHLREAALRFNCVSAHASAWGSAFRTTLPHEGDQLCCFHESGRAWCCVQVGLEPDKICKSGVELPDALKSEPLEEERLAGDLQADPCVRMAVHALADAPPLTDRL